MFGLLTVLSLIMTAQFVATTLPSTAPTSQPGGAVELIVLGSGQDGGAPQLGVERDPAWKDPLLRRTATSLGVIDHASGQRWLFDATPDLREQLHTFNQLAPVDRKPPALEGVFLTHAHIGHYTGLMFFGKEVMGTRDLPVYAMPRMTNFISTNGPWSQLVSLNNIALRLLQAGQPVTAGRLSVTPIVVPHRQEFSEVVGFHVRGPKRSFLFIPDIDRWEDWDAQGVKIEDELAKVDRAYLDGTFFDAAELPGRDLSKIPHPLISASVRRFATLPPQERAKVRFIHLNWSNPARFKDDPARKTVESAGMSIAEEKERWEF